MIKTITQLVCIKDIYHYVTGKLRFQKGKVYDVYKINTDETLKLQPEDGDRLCEITLHNNAFITLAKWREKQINSILDE